MNIDVIYKDGAFIPTYPISIKCNKLTIVIPDDVIQQESVELDILKKDTMANNHSLRHEFDKILGKFARPRTTSSAADDKKVWHRHLMKKYSQ